MKDKKILVTGGEGFIGFNLCRALYSIGCIVTSLDINLTKREDRRIDGIRYISGDTNKISEILDGELFDYIIHLGEYSRVENSYENLDLVKHSNISGTAAVLEFWRKQKCKLIYAGSSTKFSNSFKENISSERDIFSMGNEDVSPYTFTKASNTELVRMYASWFNLPYAITYFYNVYGEHENEIGDYATLIGIFKNKVKKQDSLNVVLPGTQKRNFTDVRDIIEALILITEKGLGDNFGIGSDEEYTIIEVANILNKKYGNEIKYIPERKGNRMSAKLINQKTKELGWSPKYNLKNYLESF